MDTIFPYFLLIWISLLLWYLLPKPNHEDYDRETENTIINIYEMASDASVAILAEIYKELRRQGRSK